MRGQCGFLGSLLIVFCVAACGESREADPASDARVDASPDGGRIDGSQGDASPGDSSTDGSADASDGAGGGECPSTPPTADSPCAPTGLECEYGDDPRLSCRVFARCEGTMWAVTTGNCTPLPQVMCPPTREAAAGRSCNPRDAYCSYDGLNCRCTNCIFFPVERCEGPLEWQCDAPNPDMQCPAGRPRLGDACGLPDNTQCLYGCEPGVSRACARGRWVASSSPGGCPMSTRRVKRDIRYVNDEEARALAEEVAGIRLASYEYTDPALQGTRRLGFILEDRPIGSYAGDPSSSQVDLYAYTSMLVAAYQEQQRTIEQLRRDYDVLRRVVDEAPRVTPVGAGCDQCSQAR